MTIRTLFKHQALRLLVTILQLCLLAPDYAWALHPGQFRARPNEFIFHGKAMIIPSQFGRIQSQALATRPKGLVLHIEDLHCHAEVQQNIASLLNYLQVHTRLSLVGLEGASGPVPTDKLKTFPLAQIRSQLGVYLMRQGRLSGAELFATLSSNHIELMGMEDQTSYDRSYQLALSFLDEETAGSLWDLRALFNDLKPRIYSKPLMAFDQGKEAFEQGRWPLINYLKHLKRFARAQGMKGKAFTLVNAYLKYGQSNFITSEDLHEAAYVLDRSLRNNLYINNEEKELDDKLNLLDRMEKGLSLSMTPQEWTAWQTEGNGLKQMVRFLEHHQVDVQMLLEPVAALGKKIKAVQAFYYLADERSRQLADHLTIQMKNRGLPLAVLVTGGFHTSGVKQRLINQGYSVVTIRPRITKQDLVNPYLDRLRHHYSPLEKLLAQNQKALALPPGLLQPEVKDKIDVLFKALLCYRYRHLLAEDVNLFWSQLRKMLDTYPHNNHAIQLNASGVKLLSGQVLQINLLTKIKKMFLTVGARQEQAQGREQMDITNRISVTYWDKEPAEASPGYRAGENNRRRRFHHAKTKVLTVARGLMIATMSWWSQTVWGNPSGYRKIVALEDVVFSQEMLTILVILWVAFAGFWAVVGVVHWIIKIIKNGKKQKNAQPPEAFYPGVTLSQKLDNYYEHQIHSKLDKNQIDLYALYLLSLDHTKSTTQNMIFREFLNRENGLDYMIFKKEAIIEAAQQLARSTDYPKEKIMAIPKTISNAIDGIKNQYQVVPKALAKLVQYHLPGLIDLSAFLSGLAVKQQLKFKNGQLEAWQDYGLAQHKAGVVNTPAGPLVSFQFPFDEETHTGKSERFFQGALISLLLLSMAMVTGLFTPTLPSGMVSLVSRHLPLWLGIKVLNLFVLVPQLMLAGVAAGLLLFILHMWGQYALFLRSGPSAPWIIMSSSLLQGMALGLGSFSTSRTRQPGVGNKKHLFWGNLHQLGLIESIRKMAKKINQRIFRLPNLAISEINFNDHEVKRGLFNTVRPITYHGKRCALIMSRFFDLNEDLPGSDRDTLKELFNIGSPAEANELLELKLKHMTQVQKEPTLNVHDKPGLLALVHNQQGKLIGYLSEWVEGASLEDLIKTGLISGAVFEKTIVEAEETLAHLHKQGLLHGDPTISNWMVQLQDQEETEGRFVDLGPNLPGWTMAQDNNIFKDDVLTGRGELLFLELASRAVAGWLESLSSAMLLAKPEEQRKLRDHQQTLLATLQENGLSMDNILKVYAWIGDYKDQARDQSGQHGQALTDIPAFKAKFEEKVEPVLTALEQFRELLYDLRQQPLTFGLSPVDEVAKAMAATKEKQTPSAPGAMMGWLKTLYVNKKISAAHKQNKFSREKQATLKDHYERHYQAWGAVVLEMLPLGLTAVSILGAALIAWMTGFLHPTAGLSDLLRLVHALTWLSFPLWHLVPADHRGWQALRQGQFKKTFKLLTKADKMNAVVATFFAAAMALLSFSSMSLWLIVILGQVFHEIINLIGFVIRYGPSGFNTPGLKKGIKSILQTVKKGFTWPGRLWASFYDHAIFYPLEFRQVNKNQPSAQEKQQRWRNLTSWHFFVLAAVLVILMVLRSQSHAAIMSLFDNTKIFQGSSGLLFPLLLETLGLVRVAHPETEPKVVLDKSKGNLSSIPERQENRSRLYGRSRSRPAWEPLQLIRWPRVIYLGLLWGLFQVVNRVVGPSRRLGDKAWPQQRWNDLLRQYFPANSQESVYFNPLQVRRGAYTGRGVDDFLGQYSTTAEGEAELNLHPQLAAVVLASPRNDRLGRFQQQLGRTLVRQLLYYRSAQFYGQTLSQQWQQAWQNKGSFFKRYQGWHWLAGFNNPSLLEAYGIVLRLRGIGSQAYFYEQLCDVLEQSMAREKSPEDLASLATLLIALDSHGPAIYQISDVHSQTVIRVPAVLYKQRKDLVRRLQNLLKTWPLTETQKRKRHRRPQVTIHQAA